MLKMFRKRITEVIRQNFPETTEDVKEVIVSYGECKCKTGKVKSISYPEIWQLIRQRMYIIQKGKRVQCLGKMDPFDDAIVLLFHNSWDDAEVFKYTSDASMSTIMETIYCSNVENLDGALSFFNAYHVEENGTLTQITEMKPNMELIFISKKKVYSSNCEDSQSIIVRYVPTTPRKIRFD